MALPRPNLDDRRFQDLVDEAKRMVQQRCPQWSDHNVSDPGVTLIEAFAHMTDQLIYRLNRVPDKNHVAFLDLIGLTLNPPSAARTDVTFWLSAPQPETVRIREGSEVATTRTETDEAVIFSTVRELALVPVELSVLATGSAEPGAAPAGAPPGAAAAPAAPAALTDRGPELATGRGVPCFSPVPRPGDALYFGLSEAAPSCVVALRLDFPVAGHGIDPERPPLAWEAWTGEGWTRCEVDRDGTGGFNRPGDVLIQLPDTHLASAEARHRAGWLRCVVVAPAEGQRTYSAAPSLLSAEAFTIGGTAPAVHAERVGEHLLGVSEGVPGQSFTLDRAPVIAGGLPFTVETHSTAEGWVDWTEVPHFGESGPRDRHIGVDRATGEITFGPAVREADGSLRQYGAVPAKGVPVRARPYLTGGGRRGNVARRTLGVLRSSIPYIARVENRRAAGGGVDGEDVANARLRGAMELRTRERAVTAEDFEYLTRQAAPEVARVRCVEAPEAGPGGVRVLLVPAAEDDGEGRLEFSRMACRPELLASVAAHLDARRMLGTRLVVEPPYYQGVTVVAVLRAADGIPAARVQRAALAALYRQLNPLTGGPDGAGWPFGRAVHTGALWAVLEQVPGVESVESVRLFPADLETRRRSEPADRIVLGPGSLAFSYDHQVRVDHR
ncbi:putative baseplate assembly protein [Streptomyces sp. ISL-43]|uniref:putative baseplate assembly protein n=1 Tax=Streptomyces sp. ISL-43 TaxID=2819183 RepID=UPI001BE6E731|nr:putative baseplate assembly protein [Streptomyces sp. ISL-43]MBT2448970.1 putative baseplate assembly protein [Streptomyces sp. ISL-43]